MHFKIASISLISQFLQTEGFGKWDGLTTFYREERIRFKNFTVYPGKIFKKKKKENNILGNYVAVSNRKDF